MQTMSALAQAIFPCPFVQDRGHDLMVDAELLPPRLEQAVDNEKAWSWLIGR